VVKGKGKKHDKINNWSSLSQKKINISTLWYIESRNIILFID
jgi:hypothetical protein